MFNKCSAILKMGTIKQGPDSRFFQTFMIRICPPLPRIRERFFPIMPLTVIGISPLRCRLSPLWEVSLYPLPVIAHGTVCAIPL